MYKQISTGLLFFVLLFGMACAQSETSKKVETPVQTKYQDITAEQFKAKMSNKDVVILDVRTDAEVAEGIIEGAIQLDFRSVDFKSNVQKLDKNKEYLVYCRSGGRSASASEIMQNGGFTKVSNLLGGYSSWPYK